MTGPEDWNPAAHCAVPERLAQMAEVRGRCPVAYSDRHGGVFDLLRHEDVVRAALDPETFSNAGGARYGKPLPPLEFDPPLHGEYRRILAVFFTPRRVQALELKVRAIAIEMIDALVSRRGGDLARELSYPLPALGLCALLNIPGRHWREIKTWSENTLLMDSHSEADRALAKAGHERIIAFAHEMIAERRRAPMEPEDDLTSALLAGRVGGEAMDDDLVARTLRILVSAGHNSTTSAIGNTLLHLARNPHDQANLRADPTRIPTAIEEILRFDTPVQEMPRWTTRAVTIGARELPAGARVGMFWGAANRDEAAFPDPDRCILDRKPNRHLAFGQGIHTCLGAPMARMEIRVAVEEILARTAGFELDGPVERPKFHRMGVVALPVRIEPAG